MKWITLPNGWSTLNTNGAVKNHPSLVAIRGLIRDSLSRWIISFSIGLGVTNNVVAELRGLLEGLKLALQLNITNLIIKMDALFVVNIMSSRASINAFVKPSSF